MLAFSILLIALAVFYAVWMGRFAWGFRLMLRERLHEALDIPFVSVVVAAHNEEATIEACLQSILANDYPKDRLEVIVVDDGSTDATSARVRARQTCYDQSQPLISRNPSGNRTLRLLSLPDEPCRDRAHKKRALEAAIDLARGTIILTTDADCTVPTNWLRTISRAFDDKVGFVSGPVLYREKPGLFARLQRLEFLGLVSVGAGAIGIGRPTICNGANVAFRRDVFFEVGGYQGIDHVSSGDDELLMQKISHQTTWKVRFCSHVDAVVQTDPAPTLSTFFTQRRRWASKGRHYARPTLVASLVLVYLFYVLLLGALVVLPFLPGLWSAAIMALLLKMISEALLLGPACRHFKVQKWRRLFISAQIVQMLYIVIAASLGLSGGYQWKDRRVAR